MTSCTPGLPLRAPTSPPLDVLTRATTTHENAKETGKQTYSAINNSKINTLTRDLLHFVQLCCSETALLQSKSEITYEGSCWTRITMKQAAGLRWQRDFEIISWVGLCMISSNFGRHWQTALPVAQEWVWCSIQSPSTCHEQMKSAARALLGFPTVSPAPQVSCW